MSDYSELFSRYSAPTQVYTETPMQAQRRRDGSPLTVTPPSRIGPPEHELYLADLPPVSKAAPAPETDVKETVHPETIVKSWLGW